MSEYPDNPGPLPVTDLKNKSDGGQGPLGKGDSREDLVKNLQKMLVALGYDLGTFGDNKDGVDGKFGDATGKAVKQFQEKSQDWEEKELKVDGLVGPRTSDALNRAMVGLWYDVYKTPKELTKDRVYITATKAGLKEGVSVEAEGVKKARVVGVDLVGEHVVSLLDSEGKPFSFEGEGQFKVLDMEENILAKGSIENEQELKFRSMKVPSIVELNVGEDTFTFSLEESKKED